MRKCFNGTLNIIKYVLQNDNECFHDSWLLQWNAMYKQTVTPDREREREWGEEESRLSAYKLFSFCLSNFYDILYGLLAWHNA